MDILVSLHPGGVAHLGDRVSFETLILGDEETKKNNRRAFSQGYERGRKTAEEKDLSFSPGEDGRAGGEALVSGTEAVAMGAIAGGCNFLSFYPMSPATGVGVFLAGRSEEFNIEVIQAEDEIAAVNMALGAWYAGGRGLVTTSGGGSALMTEGLSLAGMIESPLVIHLAQHPGPATGLPTRTEQGDLLFALFAGHGEFPRAILTPGTIEECFFLARRAFLLADRFQVPVIVLTDQYLLDSAYNLPVFEIPEEKIENRIIETEEDYRRYAAAEDGISPRGIPGYGRGLVAVDSDEHDERGRITEDFSVRVAMVEKRRGKFSKLEAEALEPEFFGDEDYRTLVVGWGSTRQIIRESLEEHGGKGIGGLHFSQVYPLHPKTAGYLRRAKKVVVIENNASGQFARLLKMTFGASEMAGIRKYNGLPFSREDPAAGDPPPGLRPGRYLPALRHLQSSQYLRMVRGKHLLPGRRPRLFRPGSGLCPGDRDGEISPGSILPPGGEGTVRGGTGRASGRRNPAALPERARPEAPGQALGELLQLINHLRKIEVVMN